jgi:hypothetical protein
MKNKVRYSETTGIGKMIEVKKAREKAKEMDEALLEAKAMKPVRK